MSQAIRVATFEKVSYNTFVDAIVNELFDESKVILHDGYLFKMFSESYCKNEKEFFKSVYDSIKIPSRATCGSAGYDFSSPFSFELGSGESVKIPTGIRAKIDNGWYLSCFPRSSIGFKYNVHLANTVGIVDQDYYYSDNEGHIFIKLVNSGDKVMKVNQGDRIVQGVFTKYGITYDDNESTIRNGGIGSTSNNN